MPNNQSHGNIISVLTRLFSEYLFLQADRLTLDKNENNTEAGIYKCGCLIRKSVFDLKYFDSIEMLLKNISVSPEGSLQSLLLNEINYQLKCTVNKNQIEITQIADSGSKNSGNAAASAARSRLSENIPLVMVVEDDPDQRRILEIMLKDLQYEVTLTTNGEEALQALGDNPPDLIISDMMMPKMDGKEFVKKLKRNPAYSNIPVLMLTVLAEPEKEFDLLSLGVDDYCQKTVQRNILIKRIEKLISRRL